ncbi:unnamed protein product [Cuscuta europaea]|uniref:Reverse transcriptase zinc-binding domain-containing protein n=1 Tax=Cuscuta europaea TaxID=41803 RepID=A0A9P0Z103_CUSEU|nr:unnamed protein product [Cuscuta europaea]
MLAKQAWRLTTKTYTPDSSFLEAKLGRNRSYIWRSILEAQPVLTENIRRRAGHGRDVCVSADAWLPRPGSAHVVSQRPPYIRDMNVAALRSKDSSAWNVERISSLFIAQDCRTILSIPISVYPQDDTVWWGGEKDGTFTVKSCHRLKAGPGPGLMSEWLGWTKVWGLQILPKVKFFFWQTMTGSVPVASRLCRRGVDIQPECRLRGVEEETLMHAFHSCIKSKGVWQIDK